MDAFIGYMEENIALYKPYAENVKWNNDFLLMSIHMNLN